MENPTNIIKHAPKWAWFAAAGIGAGAIGIRVWKSRATDATATGATGATDMSGAVPTSQASSPTPVIVPPVITGSGTDNGSDNAAGILTAVSGVFSPVIDDLSGIVTTTVQSNSDNLTTFVNGVEGNNSQWLAALASGGLAPQPASVAPTIIIQPNPPAAVTAGQATSSPVAPCPASHPHRSSHGCYRCVKEASGKYQHIYNNGYPSVSGNSTC